jgi:hypothetical protein
VSQVMPKETDGAPPNWYSQLRNKPSYQPNLKWGNQSAPGYATTPS